MMTRTEMTAVDTKLAAAHARADVAIATLRAFCAPRTRTTFRGPDVVTWAQIVPARDWPVIDEAVAERAAALDEIAALREVWRANGCWSRFYLVTNGHGHVHRETNCSTCYPTTTFGWLVDLAGADEAEMVATYGSDACTVCFPTAPALPGWGSSKSARDKAAAKGERAAKAAARKVEAEAKRQATKVREMKATLRDAIGNVEFRAASMASTYPHLTERENATVATLPAKIAALSGESVEAILADARSKARKLAVKDLQATFGHWMLNQPSFDGARRDAIYEAARTDLRALGVKGY